MLRRKRQLYNRGFDNNILNSFTSSFPVFSTNILADTLFSGGLSGLFDGGRYGQESKIHAVNALSPGSYLSGSSTSPSYTESMEHFPNPFPTVPMDNFDFETFKSASEDDAVFGGKANYVATSFPPMNFNPQTGTFYEPVFGSHIPASLMGDFTPLHQLGHSRPRLPPKIAPVTRAVFQNATGLPIASPSAGKAKLVAYDYMYKPLSMLRPSHKRPPLRDKIPVSTTQISYEKVNLPPMRDNIETTSKPTYKLDPSPSPHQAVKPSSVTWYMPDVKDTGSQNSGFSGISSNHFVPKPVFTPERNHNTAKTAPFVASSSSSNQQQNFLYKPLFAPARPTGKQSYEVREKYSPNQLKPQVIYASHPELPLKQYKDYHQSYNHGACSPVQAARLFDQNAFQARESCWSE